MCPWFPICLVSSRVCVLFGVKTMLCQVCRYPKQATEGLGRPPNALRHSGFSGKPRSRRTRILSGTTSASSSFRDLTTSGRVRPPHRPTKRNTSKQTADASEHKIWVPVLTNSVPIKAGDALFFYRKAEAKKTKHNPQPITIGQLTKALGKETARKDKS